MSVWNGLTNETISLFHENRLLWLLGICDYLHVLKLITRPNLRSCCDYQRILLEFWIKLVESSRLGTIRTALWYLSTTKCVYWIIFDSNVLKHKLSKHLMYYMCLQSQKVTTWLSCNGPCSIQRYFFGLQHIRCFESFCLRTLLSKIIQ